MYKISDYLNRLKKVSVREIFYRLKRTAREKYFAKRAGAGKPLLNVPEIDPSFLQEVHFPLIIRDFKPGPDLKAPTVEPFFEFEKKNRNVFFSKIKLDIHDPDIRSVWESARLQDCYFSSGETCAGRVVKWREDNPFLFGVHYLSPMECGLRIPVFFFVLKDICREKSLQKEANTILSAIYEHAWWISRNLALYSSIGNHTVCECIGLIFAGVVFRATQEGQAWLKKGIRLLDQEISHQIFPDGGPVEQSLSYHRFVMDLYWVALNFLGNNNLHDCSSWKKVLKQGEFFLTTLSLRNLPFPSIGDGDDGYAFASGLSPDRRFDSTETQNLRTDFGCVTFQDAGYSVIRRSDELLIIFDHGPLGMAPLYNHGHADAMSIVLYRKGLAFMIDPGTFRYNGEPEYRKYFKGTGAHNTICIDGQDQARQVSSFIWNKPYEARLVEEKKEIPGQVILRAFHNGYERLNEPVLHHRQLEVHDGICCMIKDTFSGQGNHEYELNFHLSPEVAVEKSGDWLVLDNNGERISVYDPEHLFLVARGQTSPLKGWYSPSYGVIQKTNTLYVRKTGRPTEISFTILIVLDKTRLASALKLFQEYETKCEDIRY
jgi:hypothetical protein